MTTEATERDLIREEARVVWAQRNFPYYCEYVHNRPLLRHQEDWAWHLQQPKARTALITPPETFKSSTVRMFVEWTVGRDPDATFLWVMNTATQSQSWVEAIADTVVNNERYHTVFPHIQPDRGRGWTKDRLFVTRPNTSNPQPTLYGTGIDGPYQGMHVKYILLDDPTDQDDVASEAKMAAQRERLRGVLIDRLQEGGSFIALFTRWGEADLHRDLVEMGFNVVQYPIEGGRYPWGGRLLAPELFPDDRLQRIRETKGSALYALTYLCDPNAATGSMVKREWWKFYSETPEFDLIIHSWDLSIGKTQTSDYSAFTSWGRAEDGFYVLDAGRWRLSPDERLQKIDALWKRDKPEVVLVEKATPSEDFITMLEKHTDIRLNLMAPRGKDKVSRLLAVIPFIEWGRVWLPAKAPWVNDYMDELASFPGGAHDDWVDSTSYALKFLDKRTRSHSSKIWNSADSLKPRNSLVGGRRRW